MRSSSLASTLLFVLSAVAQHISIGSPANKVTVSAGSELVVEVDKPNSLSASTEVSLVIAMNECPPNARCDSPADVGLDHILYEGPYTPKYAQGENVVGKPPHQNFTVIVPDDMEGRVLLVVSHSGLLGAGAVPFEESANVTLYIQAAE